ncbi:MAG: hypothetical protein ACO2PN_20760 [Pyrobaculum sp.]|jgi:hypothetical protein
MSGPITISLEEEEQAFEQVAAPMRPHRMQTAPQLQHQVQAAPQLQATGSRDWKECLYELLRTAPPEELMRLINREGLKEVLKEIAQNDPLLRLFFLLYG